MYFTNRFPAACRTSISGPTICARGSNVKWNLRMLRERDGYLWLEIKSNQSTEAAVSACIYDVDNDNTQYTDAPYTFQPVHNNGRLLT